MLAKIKTYRRWKRCRGQNIGRFEGGVREGFGLRSACEPCRARCDIDDKKARRNIIVKKIILMKRIINIIINKLYNARQKA